MAFSSTNHTKTMTTNDWFQVLNNKVVFITGAAGGIGSAICQTCVLQGARVVITDINKIAADQLLIQILEKKDQTAADQLMSLELDITNEKAIEQAVQIVIDKWGTIDVVVNAAAIFIFGQVENTSADDWSRNFDVNVHGYALVIKHIAPYMKKQRSGSIIQFGSISGVIVQSPFLPYGTSKAAIIQMSKYLAVDLGPFNIRCNSISPGLTITPPVRALANSNGLSIEQFTDQIVKDQCLKRSADPQEIANLVVFLASDLCPFITGTNLIADGGYTAV